MLKKSRDACGLTNEDLFLDVIAKEFDDISVFPALSKHLCPDS
jgi:hypothetical protein